MKFCIFSLLLYTMCVYIYMYMCVLFVYSEIFQNT